MLYPAWDSDSSQALHTCHTEGDVQFSLLSWGRTDKPGTADLVGKRLLPSGSQWRLSGSSSPTWAARPPAGHFGPMWHRQGVSEGLVASWAALVSYRLTHLLPNLQVHLCGGQVFFSRGHHEHMLKWRAHRVRFSQSSLCFSLFAFSVTWPSGLPGFCGREPGEVLWARTAVGTWTTGKSRCFF